MHNASRIRVGVIGASGYGGAELVRLLVSHPHALLTYLAGSRETSQPLTDVFPHFVGQLLPALETVNLDKCADLCDVVFVALPTGTSGAVAQHMWERGKKVIDLSGDLRLPTQQYAEWYGHQPVDPLAQSQAIYGLTEWFRGDIQDATLIANPGCYATAVLLGLLPAVRCGLWNTNTPLLIDAKSGVSGAGKTPTKTTHLAELTDNFMAYKVGRHQHVPEIEQILGDCGTSKVVMTTQLLPTVRGIFTSCYVQVRNDVDIHIVREAYLESYGHTPFVSVCSVGQFPELKHVRGSNQCRIGLHLDDRTGVLQVFSVIDNLQKGAAGQAVQNFNVMHSLPDTEGLQHIPLYP